MIAIKFCYLPILLYNFIGFHEKSKSLADSHTLQVYREIIARLCNLSLHRSITYIFDLFIHCCFTPYSRIFTCITAASIMLVGNRALSTLNPKPLA